MLPSMLLHQLSPGKNNEEAAARQVSGTVRQEWLHKCLGKLKSPGADTDTWRDLNNPGVFLGPIKTISNIGDGKLKGLSLVFVGYK